MDAGFGDWNLLFAAPIIARAIIGRLLHRATVLNVNGKSYRMEQTQILPTGRAEGEHGEYLPTLSSNRDDFQGDFNESRFRRVLHLDVRGDLCSVNENRADNNQQSQHQVNDPILPSSRCPKRSATKCDTQQQAKE